MLVVIAGCGGQAESRSTPRVVGLGAGHGETAALLADGAAYTWGTFPPGRAGTTSATLLRPTKAGDLGHTLELAWGELAGCALDDAGVVRCWGANDQGQLGRETGGATDMTPEPVEGIGAAVHIAVARERACALLEDGTVACWGVNAGTLGLGTTNTTEPVPKILPGLDHAVRVALSNDGGCVVRSDTSVWCWGNGGFAGAPDYTQFWSTPRRVEIPPADDVGCTNTDDYALLSDGRVVSSDPAVAPLDNVVSISHGGSTLHGCAVHVDGSLECWGDNSYGEIGLGYTSAREDPQSVPGLTKVDLVVAGSLHTCAHEESGKLYCWGDNAFGDLGDGTRTQRASPVAVLPFR